MCNIIPGSYKWNGEKYNRTEMEHDGKQAEGWALKK